MMRKETRENYLKLIYMMQINDELATGSEIARILEVSRPTVSIAVKKLKKEGYIQTYSSDGALLTEKGMEIAAAVTERYQFFLNLLLILGIRTQTAKEDACRLEHGISEESFRAMQDYFAGSQAVQLKKEHT